MHHRDISPNNLMYYWTEQGRIVGVLNDFDLAVLASSAAQSSKERTGTLPYMADELLWTRGEPIAHLYGEPLNMLFIQEVSTHWWRRV